LSDDTSVDLSTRINDAGDAFTGIDADAGYTTIA